MSLPSPAVFAPRCAWPSSMLCTLAGFWGTDSYFPLRFRLFPSHLDNHSLWEPKIFATCCFRIIMYSIQVGSWGGSGRWPPAGDARACLGVPAAASTAGLSQSRRRRIAASRRCRDRAPAISSATQACPEAGWVTGTIWGPVGVRGRRRMAACQPCVFSTPGAYVSVPAAIPSLSAKPS